MLREALYARIRIVLRIRTVAAVTRMTLVKRFEYRGDATEEFSNSYQFRDTAPNDPAGWEVFTNDLVEAEKPVINQITTFVRAYGYNDSDPSRPSVFCKDFENPGPAPAGTLPIIPGSVFAGDQAACVEWRTGSKNTRGKWIYLRKYLHGGMTDATVADDLDAGYITRLETYAALLQSSAFHGGLCPPNTAMSIEDHKVIPYVTTRTLKRRGKRPLRQT